MSPARILLVEDDAALNKLLKRHLERQGHSVDSYDSGARAWTRFSADPALFDLVIVDLTLPDLPGDVLVKQIVGRSASTRVLITSGAADPGTASMGTHVSFLQKPFLPKALAESVASALSR